ncbi:phosphoribosylaminoimidazolesuccinocarboxamide synthase [Halorubrum ezzemoulense]|uniref:Phosphoribosylaminoimidazole-succinocarboxamide synthase n=1 Tax=Halorubrum ezzemoulense TaxID=337243 RepID=A0ABT4YZZ4_HALEZ|nr:phosphoribosylaminoimidazolesuccinocarboxamide synthase [Halorubrum ezzemoulense]MDB2243641.1 phosphoribosylaminoimidazolesuccinocarboxamide synthase [Halorubrum ezzemoulense]MDB2251707.1 phosphoribosylaminoimidazolesuccinocarboxamide synthase [Halorubrum ezzemoulense]MDB2277377.1 phosphoribosylaminoimidazolesuccinocarboxamide synthase [Halorubrum ezzemoulense]MDB2284087.1 phosphoribosylaminoimidazolesuccinocarboxamide synthase [Halorubrum ezzemoulense]MDB2289004.1 phosphoribosylaminoimidaz
MTSVKEFRVDEPATADGLGRGRFAFTDAYSVFDWGQMPDAIPHKGASLCAMGAFNFELLEDAGVPTHYRGVVDPGTVADDGTEPDPVPLAEATAPPTEMAIDLTQVPDLSYEGPHAGYDYEAFHAAGGGNYLVPLEVVFRNRVPVGSSLRKRAEPADLGLDDLADGDWPDEPVDLPEPVVEFSTKYEQQDRYLTRAEADEIAGAAAVDALEALARDVNRVVTKRAEATGFVHEDGKIECLYVDGELRVADVVGTFDENRFSYGGRGISKEVVRQWYKANDPDWVAAVGEAKDAVADRDIDDWRELCDPDPDPLPPAVVDAVSDLYAAGANAYTDREWFDAPEVEAALDAAAEL